MIYMIQPHLNFIVILILMHLNVEFMMTEWQLKKWLGGGAWHRPFFMPYYTYQINSPMKDFITKLAEDYKQKATYQINSPMKDLITKLAQDPTNPLMDALQ